MSLYRTYRGRSAGARVSRPRQWVGTKWTPFLVHLGSVTVYGVARRSFGSALIRWEKDGAAFAVLPISYYGDLTMLQRRKVADGQAEGQMSAAPLDYKTMRSLQNLIAHAAVTRYDDGSPRRPGRVTVETRGALWQVTVTDPDACAVLRVSGPNFSEALQAADLLLGSPDTLWEPAPWLAQEQPRKRRK